MDPFTLKFNKFTIKEILGYPHAGNDVFYVRGIGNQGETTTGFLKVERQETADVEKGSINELDQTQPDIIIPNPIKKINFGSNGQAILNGDKTIMEIIEREGI